MDVKLVIDFFTLDKTYDLHVLIDGEIDSYFSVQGIGTVRELVEEMGRKIEEVKRVLGKEVQGIQFNEYEE